MADSRGALANQARRERAERLELRVPTTATQLPAVRALAADLTMRMDYDLDSVEDLRLAVDEACAILAAVGSRGEPLTVVFETSRSGLHIEAWVPAKEGTDVPRNGFGWAVLQTLVDAVDGRPSTQADVPGGDGSAQPVAVIAMDKFLPGQRRADVVGEAGQSVPVTQ